jgi:hypothetical protein
VLHQQAASSQCTDPSSLVWYSIIDQRRHSIRSACFLSYFWLHVASSPASLPSFTVAASCWHQLVQCDIGCCC